MAGKRARKQTELARSAPQQVQALVPPRAARTTATAVAFDPRLRFETWRELGARIGRHWNGASWWLGDWLVFGRMKYGRRYKEAVEATGFDYQTLRNYAVVARRFPPSRRRDDLSFQHHAELSALPDAEQDRWLDAASAQRWSRNELRRRLRRSNEGAGGRHAAGMLRLALGGEDAERWHEAAERSGMVLATWARRALNEAANHR